MDFLKNKYFTNSIWLVLEKIILMMVSLVVGVLVVRYLGKEEFGFYSYVLSVFIIAEVFCTFGQNNIVVKEIVKDIGKSDEILGTAFRFQVLGGLICFLGVFLVLFFSEYSYTEWYKFIFVFAALPIKSFRVISFYFDARVLGKYNAITRTTAILITNALKLLVIFTQSAPIYFYVILLVDAVLVSTFFLFFLKEKEHQFSKWKTNSHLMKKFFKSGFLLMLSSFLITIYLRIDQVMITNLLGNAENGLYSSAIRVSSTWYNIGWAVILSIFPLLIESKKISNELFKKRMLYLIQLVVFIGIGIGIVFTFYAKEVIEFLFTKDFSGAVGVLKVHIWSSILIFLYYLQEKWYVINNKEKLFFYASLLGLLLNCGLNFISLKVYGIDAAAYNTLFGLIFSLLIFPVFFKGTREVFFLQIRAFVSIYRFEFISLLKKKN